MKLERVPKEPPRWMRFPIELLVLACVVVGVLPSATVGPVLDVAVRAVLGADTPVYSLAPWHGLNLPLAMSALALAGGTALYLGLHRYLAGAGDRVPLLPPIDGRRIFDRLMLMLTWRWARALEALLGTHRLQPQLRWLLVLVIAVGLWPLYRYGFSTGDAASQEADYVLALAWVAGAACALGAAWQARFHRLVALMLAGGAGIVTVVTFVRLSAPDLALTQLLVEIVTTVLLLLGLRWLPKRTPMAWTWARVRAVVPRRLGDLAIAVAAGGGLGAIAYAAMTRPLPETVSRYFVEQAYPAGGGTNVVNVILVDFRGFDTLGEITVLGIVAVTVYSLLRRFRPAPESIEAPQQQNRQSRASARQDLLVPGFIMRLMFPAIGVLALYLLVRGHNLPGGGFVAGLTLAVAVILQYMAGGTRWAEARIAIRPVRWIGAGLLLAAATGAGAWIHARPFLASATAHVRLPLVGELHVPSAMMFDLGVFAVVVGATGLVLIALAHQSVRAHREPPAP